MFDRVLVTPLFDRVLVTPLFDRVLVTPLFDRVLVTPLFDRVLVRPLRYVTTSQMQFIALKIDFGIIYFYLKRLISFLN